MFKYKPDKLKNQEKIRTLDETHRNYIKSFEQSRMSLDLKKQKLAVATEKLDRLNKSNMSTQTHDVVKIKSNLKDEITRLKREIDDITHNTSELDYYSKIDNILLRYYEIIDNTDGNSSTSSTHTTTLNEQLFAPAKINRKRTRTQQPSQQNILCFFGKPTNDTTNAQEKSNTSPSETSENVAKMEPILPKNRAFLHDQYMTAINSTTSRNAKRTINTDKYCEKCKIERTLVQSEGMYVCERCGEAEIALIESDIPNYKESSTDSKTIYPYKRLNHLVE